MSAANAIPPDLTPDEQAEISRRFAKALLNFGLGIFLPLIYFWALIAWLVNGRDHVAISETISFAFGIGFFPAIGIGLYLLLGGMADCLIYAYFRRHPGAFRDRRADHRLWLLTPPGRDWPRKYDEKGQQGEAVNRPLRLLYANNEWRYIEERLTKARNRIRMYLRILAGYVAVLVVWSLDLTAPLRAEEAVFGMFVILAFFIPFVIMVLLFKECRNLRRFKIYQKEHCELLQRHNRTSRRIH
tara:strand:+ start:502 stop:1230 length:729 start_codon:yes stop_codon:yes gene_type:complete